VQLLVAFYTHLVVIRIVSSPTIGVPLPVVAPRLVEFLLLAALSALPILFVQFLLSLVLSPVTFRVALIWWD
jgi:hypothetical protein